MVDLSGYVKLASTPNAMVIKLFIALKFQIMTAKMRTPIIYLNFVP